MISLARVKGFAICWFTLIGSLCAAPDESPFPQATTKKGLQVQLVDDALALGIRHATINVPLGSLFSLQPSKQTEHFEWQGKTWQINRAFVAGLDQRIKVLTDGGVIVYAILIVYPTRVPDKDKLLVHPQADFAEKFTVAAANTVTPEGTACYRALLAYLARRYGDPSAPHGRIRGWIIGNEVNSSWQWDNAGDRSLAAAAADYERTVRIAYEVISSFSKHDRIYLSLDHHWQSPMARQSAQRAYAGRALLDEFARIARGRGDFPWHLAYHPYPENLGNPRVWLDKTALNTFDTPRITFKNLPVLARYLAREELLWRDEQRRIILSEQGIHCPAVPQGEELQAAGFAYAWERVARIDGIDALIWHRHVDHAKEGGLKLGLWENKPDTISEPGRRRPLYELFRLVDTPEWPRHAERYLPIVGLKSWEEIGSGDDRKPR